MKPRRMIKVTLILFAAGAVSACATSQPTRYFSLNPEPAAAPKASAPRHPVQVTAFQIPAVLDRQSMVRSGPGGSLIIDEQDQWGAPLGSMAGNILAQDLSARLPEGSVIMPNAPAPPDAAQLIVTTSTFRPGTDGEVHLKGSWILMSGLPPKTVISRDIDLKDNVVPGDASSQAQAMSRLLGRLADKITAEIEQSSHLASINSIDAASRLG